MSNKTKIMLMKSRVALLSARTDKENGNIIKKLNRRIKKFEREG